jgi:SPP1 family predicted phage head-tail adaptor
MLFWKRDNKGRSTERRQRITVLRVARERAAGGFTEKSTTPTGPYWASVEPLTESQRVKFQAVSVDATHRITLDGAIEVDEGDRIEFEGRQFEVMTVRRVDEGNRDKVIITQEIRPGQKK